MWRASKSELPVHSTSHLTWLLCVLSGCAAAPASVGQVAMPEDGAPIGISPSGTQAPGEGSPEVEGAALDPAAADAGSVAPGDPGSAESAPSTPTGMEPATVPSEGTDPQDVGSLGPGASDPGGSDPGGSDPGGSDPGGSGTGGSDAGGTGGSDPSTNVAVLADTGGVVNIDDFQDGDGWVPGTHGIIGAWYVYNDGTAGGVQMPTASDAFLPEEDPGEAGQFVGHTAGGGFTDWGAGLGLDFNNPGENAPKGVLDASAATRLVFRARGNVTVRVKLSVAAVVPVAEGGSCAPMVGDCSDSHGANLALTDTWKEHSFTLADLSQEGWGVAAPFETSQLVSLQFQLPASVDFDLWIDDLRFE